MRHLQLVDRLRGHYHLPVDDGLGPLNGSYTFSRSFSGQPEIQLNAADRIEALESGQADFDLSTDDLIKQLRTPGYFMGLPDPYVPPIHEEAALYLEGLLNK